MQFNFVIANPPYNASDIHMNFASLAFDLAIDNSIIIMPAKWQCKGDKTREKLYSIFREKVTPYMSYINFYPDSLDIFDITELSGIAYYITDKNIHEIKIIENKSSLNKHFNDKETREFTAYKHSLHNKGQIIISKVQEQSNSMYKPSNCNRVKPYQYWCNALITGVGDFSKMRAGIADKGKHRIMSTTDGKLQLLAKGEINTTKDIELGLQHDSYDILFASDNYNEVKFFCSYIYTKFVRFLIFNSICGLRSIGQDVWWRFVPSQTFDHEFTDDELYEKYNLSQEDIDVIEGTIKDRNLQDVYSWIKIKENGE